MDTTEGLNALFEHATEGMLIVNEDGQIIRINPSAEKLFGYANQELLNRKIEVLVPKRFEKQHEKDRLTYKNNPHARSMGAGIDLFGRRKDGSEFPVEVSLSPYESERGRFVIAFIVDITQRKLAEEKLKNYSSELQKQVEERTMILHEAIGELEKTKAELHDALMKERELNDLKSRFVSVASHEFRTPLTTIASSVSLVARYAETNDKDKQTKHIHRIKNAIDNLTDILDDFLSLSKLEEGKVNYVPEPFELEPFINETVNEMQQIAKTGQTISYKHVGSHQAVFLDRKILKNVMLNLVSNAIKFSVEGKPIEIHSQRTGGALIITVTDHGVGIPKADQSHLFERFFRANNVTNVQGTGLGLSIVAKYVELMNGSIQFKSTENIGTTFTLTFNIDEKNSAHRR